MPQSERLLPVSAWAAELCISRQAAYGAVRRLGIPQQPDGTIDADAATILYRQRTRYRVNPKRMAAARQPAAPHKNTPAELLELLNDLIDLAVGDDFDDACKHIGTVLLELPPEMQDTVRLPFGVWNRLCGEDQAP